MYFSVIIPVFNRPAELNELLQSLAIQTYKEFEVIIIDDGSTIPSKAIIELYQHRLVIRYLFQNNSGQGFARNHGMELAKGDFFVIFDSDVILPENYFEVVLKALVNRNLDAFGGPDAASDDFSSLQKAMDFAMTSFWTTGGIRGKMKDPSNFQARGFNMGVARKVFTATGGFVDPNQGEDIEWSIRIKKAGFKLQLVQEAFVYHKRKNTLLSFSKQSFSFGRNRVNVSRFHPGAIKLVHWLPTLFLIFCVSIPVFYFGNKTCFYISSGLFLCWTALVIISSSVKSHSIKVGLLSWLTSVTQLLSYGAGMPFELLKKISRI
jgi:glycosyltransferase involved in cell wall biosynthesis